MFWLFKIFLLAFKKILLQINKIKYLNKSLNKISFHLTDSISKLTELTFIGWSSSHDFTGFVLKRKFYAFLSVRKERHNLKCCVYVILFYFFFFFFFFFPRFPSVDNAITVTEVPISENLTTDLGSHRNLSKQ